MNSPTLFAWVTDLSDDTNRGRAFGSLYIALEFGIMLGALFSGFIFAWWPGNFILPFGAAAVFAILSFVYVTLNKSK
jgi:predicted MFS family arabinose efflux permease